MADRLPRKLVAILYADVAGYSRLTGEDEDTTHRTLSDYLDVISTTIESHNGQVKHYAGDAVLAKFDAVVDAMSAAVAIQNELKTRNQDVADDRKVLFRVGVNLGDVIEDRGDIYGDGVNVAARLESLADPGSICISDAVRSAVGKKLDLYYEDMGEQEVKNISEPVRVYKVAMSKEGAVVKSDKPSLKLPDKPSIAVLPFINMSTDPEQEYFSDGITEDLITGLSKNPDLYVISRNSSFTYKGKKVSARDIKEDLGVQYILEGSVRRAGQRLRITAQLTDADNDRQIWAERYDRDLHDIFEVQDEVVGSIVHALAATDGAVEKSARGRKMRASAADLTAYDCYLQAREHFYRPGDAGFTTAQALLEKAIEMDPTFARGYSALAWLHFLRFKLFLTESFDNIKDTALELALKSIRLDPLDYRGHWVLGMLYIHEGKHAQSLAEFDRALNINSNDANLLIFSAAALNYSGRVDDSLQRCQQAIRLNPNCPDWYWWELGMCYFHLGQYEEALGVLQKMTEPTQARRILAATYAHLGRMDEARLEAKEFLKHAPHFSIKEWAKTQFYIDPKELSRYTDGLRKAGLPE